LKQLATAKPSTRLLSNTYFDTPDGNLKHHDMVLRVQRRGQHGLSVFS
jgi:inorganic triphosphatase YgiF